MGAGEHDPQPNNDGTPVASFPVTVTRSEEQLRIHLASVPVERVRLERYIVSEERTITVVIHREEVRLVREPILPDEQEQAVSAPGLDQYADHTMLLREEQVTVTKSVVPVERVTLVKSIVTVDEDVSLERRKEHVDVSRPEASTISREAP
ncbi:MULTISPECIES: DUF2382 domain-containing protein [Cryobacterium]|uniref:DUF2382 domain-containing protein n=1 Tax=Cryobacterium breve TaxID=1259258 RepID=A0ABY2J157_9MICO|nr:MULTISPECIES: DUF2382 domain-containing protein [Cryobacterium]TFC94104.1 DUF2382 domain-containing protein [Cryobacterium sp. TmT3-12]TFC98665.1 DUF2382 domain-containing protein [Cryobacterium breve]